MSELTAERLRQLLSYDPETGVFRWLPRPDLRASALRLRRLGQCGRDGKLPTGSSSTGYWQIMIDNRNYTAHRLAWLHMTGAWPEAEIDHCNGDRTDNRWSNLRPAVRGENCRNKRKQYNTTSCFKGVS